MLPPFIIEQIRQREERERSQRHDEHNHAAQKHRAAAHEAVEAGNGGTRMIVKIP